MRITMRTSQSSIHLKATFSGEFSPLTDPKRLAVFFPSSVLLPSDAQHSSAVRTADRVGND